MSNRLLFLSRSDVEAAGLPMASIIEALERAFAERGAGRAEMPPKPGIHPGAPGNDNFIHAMPASIPALGSAGGRLTGAFALPALSLSGT